MARKVKWLAALFVAAVLGYIVMSPMTTPTISCEVCVDFKGREACRTARGPTRDGAIVTARDNAGRRIPWGSSSRWRR